MRKFLFVEYNMSGMKWVSPENPVFTLVEAATPAEALEKWVEDGAQCWTEECIEAQTEGHSDADSVLETAWGCKQLPLILENLGRTCTNPSKIDSCIDLES